MARHFLGFDSGLAEKAQTFQSHPGLLDIGRRGGSGFHLPHFAPQYIIGCFQIALEVDPSHIGALARIDKELHGNGIVFFVDLGDTGHLGEIITVVAQAPGEVLLGAGHQLLRENLPLGHQQEALEVRLRQHQVARQAHRADGENLALGNIGSDVDLFHIGRDRHLGGVDGELQVTAVHVIGGQFFQVAGEFFLGILVIVTEKRQPAGGLELKQVGDFLVAESLVADHVDVLDGGDGALIDVDIDSHPVARLGDDLGLDIGVVPALLHVLALQFQLHPLQRRALEYLPHGQTGSLEAVQQSLGFDGLVALDIDFTDAGALDHDHHQHIVVPADVDIVEVAGGKQAARRGADRRIIHHIAHRNR